MNDTATGALRSHLETLFCEELQDNLGVLSAGLRELGDPMDDDVSAAVVRDLFRAAHSLKGAAHSAGVSAAVKPCRQLEERLAAVRAGHAKVDDEFRSAVAHEVAALAQVRQQLHDRSTAPDAPTTINAGSPAQPTGIVPEGRARVAVRALDDLVRQTAALSSAADQLQVLTEYLGILRETTNGPLGAIITDFNDLRRSLGRAVGQISTTAQRLRMEPVEDVTAGLDHMVRALCRATGKGARLVVEGGDVELDRDVADSIREPLLHLVRNAVDHGIEPPERRLAAGKPAEGEVTVSAALDGGRVRITVRDDGAGLDVAALRAAAGVASTAVDGHELAFLPGLSTAPALTDVSGRGVGLDAVRARIESLGGSVRLKSREGTGTEAIVRVPTSLAVLRVLLARVGSEVVALPVTALDRLQRAAAGQVQMRSGELAVVDAVDAPRPAIYLGTALGIAEREPVGRPMTVVELSGEDTVLLVDAVESDRETLLQPLPRRLRGNRMLLGAVLLPQDRVALVVNPSTCVREGRLL